LDSGGKQERFLFVKKTMPRNKGHKKTSKNKKAGVSIEKISAKKRLMDKEFVRSFRETEVKGKK
jgi:hypothetical protein